MTRRRHLEHDAQVAIFRWCEAASGRFPELRLIFSVPNAARRSPRQGAYLKAEGLRAGVPDIWLPVARGRYHGLVIELKEGLGRATPEQKAWLLALNEQGYRATLCRGYEAATLEIAEYLALPVVLVA